jgi:hypothetical protein
MNDKVKRGLGDNSKNNSDYISMYEKNAVKEMMTDMKKLAKEAFRMIYRIGNQVDKLRTGDDELSEKQENWNFNVDTYNDWVMQHDPNPATNKKKLRKKYKPAKLSKLQLAEVGKSIEEDITRVVDTVTDIEATVNAYEDPDTFQEWIEAEKEKEVK